ncbi:MAG TPA: methyltransferase domain-containing protein, partial [Actinomycetota bacterium]|nr:methyltransferase domain-containing protein [Actinomycetota bacterium]
MDTWDPERYGRFAAERAAPFHDLLALVSPVPGGRVVDLGCGSGELTAQLHRLLAAGETLGLDSSPAMLERATALAADGLRFELRDIAGFGGGGWDVVFSNAALHWLPDHEALFGRLVAALAAGGQLAVQMPANHDHPTHLVAAEVAGEEPFSSAL